MFSFLRKILVLALALSASCVAVDRNAFTFTKYDLEVRVDPDGQSLAARGRITLRNDSTKPQGLAVLQISSSLEWRLIELGGKPLEYLSEPLTTDIDHTGKVTEAVITLPAPVAPKANVEIDVGYSGTIPEDAMRLTRREVPTNQAQASEWDRISATFTGVRGIGHVIWYPVSTDPANMSDNNVFSTISLWQSRQAQTALKARFCWIAAEDQAMTVVANGNLEGMGGGGDAGEGNRAGCSTFSFDNLQRVAPTFAIAPFATLTKPLISLYFQSGHELQANDYALAAEKVEPQIEEWFGKPTEKVQVIELPENGDAPFNSGAMLFTPLDTTDKKQVEVQMAHQLTLATFHSARPWIAEGLASFAPSLVREQTNGRRPALEYLNATLPVLADAETQNTSATKPSGDAAQSLVSTDDEVYFRIKAMWVWAMLRDLVGNKALHAALANYRAADDKDPTYVQRLIAAQNKRDLEWFFDDWVYRDRGLPELKIESAVPRQTLENSYVVAVTIENSGGAGAEIPVTLRSSGGEETLRLLVPAHQKVTTRLTAIGKPTEITINDGSVPEGGELNHKLLFK
jgi:hypothetical protein